MGSTSRTAPAYTRQFISTSSKMPSTAATSALTCLLVLLGREASVSAKSLQFAGRTKQIGDSCSGVAKNFVRTPYWGDRFSGFYVDVDTSACGAEFRNDHRDLEQWKQPFVQTQLNCKAHCWLTMGTSTIKWKGPTNFVVWIAAELAFKDPSIVKEQDWHLQWTMVKKEFV